MIINIFESIEKVANNFKEWIIQNNSPAIMIVFFLIGLAVFFLTYNALHKHD